MDIPEGKENSDYAADRCFPHTTPDSHHAQA
jgi:hypothetical protein